MFLIETVSTNQSEILNNIIKLYCPDGFDLDPTYSKGVFYKNVPGPKLKYDIEPRVPNVKQADCRKLPFGDKSLSSIVFDPLFVCGSRKDGKPGIIKERFGCYRSSPSHGEHIVGICKLCGAKKDFTVLQMRDKGRNQICLANTLTRPDVDTSRIMGIKKVTPPHSHKLEKR